MYPASPQRQDWFFTDFCQRVWQPCLVDHRPGAVKLAELMKHADPLIDSIRKGTDLEEMLKKNIEGKKRVFLVTKVNGNNSPAVKTEIKQP